jgi:ribosomal protein L11 methyltransferase
MRYVEVAFTVPAESAELWLAKLLDEGAGGVEERGDDTFQKAPPGQATLVVWKAPEEVDAWVVRVLLSARGGLPEALVARRDRHEDEWRDVWKKWFGVHHIGKFVIVPSWEQHAAKADEWIIEMDPGRAFGTGTHASTRLCLRAIEQMDGPRARVLDVGCGSGVLSIAAAKRFAARITGIDLDPDAVEVSHENAQRNGLVGRASFSSRPLGAVWGRYDLIVANIQPEVLIPMAPSLLVRLAPAGRLVLSGILAEAAAPVEEAYRGLRLVERLDEDGWRALVYSP